ncbi:MAG: hypothetical protein WDO13_17735 [Verrucomicrobiota bacterium]
MSNKSKRALRRHHNARVLARTRRIVRHWFIDGGTADEITRCARRLRDNLKYCRCHACRNPRWDGELTRQERRAPQE